MHTADGGDGYTSMELADAHEVLAVAGTGGGGGGGGSVGQTGAAACADVDAPAAVFARAQELHVQAQAAGVHSVESRLEMVTKAHRLLEGLVTHLASANGAADPCSL